MRSLKKSLLAAVGNRVSEFGFDGVAKGQSFWRCHAWGRESLHLSFIDHEGNFDVTADVGIRFNELEELVQKENKLLTAKEKADTYSMGAELGNIAQGKTMRWNICADKDIDAVASQIVAYFSEVGLPYLDKYCAPKEAFAVLSGDGPDSWLHMPIHGERAKLAVGLAFLGQDSAVFHETIQSKMAYLVKQNDPSIHSFRQFTERLTES